MMPAHLTGFAWVAENASDDIVDHLGDVAGLVVVLVVRAVAVRIEVEEKTSARRSLALKIMGC